MVPQATIEHQLANRIRLKVPGKRDDLKYFTEVAAFLVGQRGITAVKTTPAAASITVEHGGSFKELAALTAGAQLFELSAPVLTPPTPTPLASAGAPSVVLQSLAWALGGLAAYQAAVAHNFGSGVENIWTAYAAGTVLQNRLFAWLLVAIGLRQVGHGRWLGSATSLLFYAMYVARMAQQPSSGTRRPVK